MTRWFHIFFGIFTHRKIGEDSTPILTFAYFSKGLVELQPPSRRVCVLKVLFFFARVLILAFKGAP